MRTLYEQHLITCKGWSDAAGSRPMNTAYDDDPDYEFGYKLGLEHRRSAFAAIARKYGVEVRTVHAATPPSTPLAVEMVHERTGEIPHEFR